MIGMDQYELIRTASRVYKKSIRQIARETGHDRRTVRKALAGIEPKYRQRGARHSPVMGPVADRVEGWLRADAEAPAKQRHTAHRIWQRLSEEHGFRGAEVTVRRFVRVCKQQLGMGGSQAVIPLDPEVAREAEVDWGEAWVRVAGVPRPSFQSQLLENWALEIGYVGNKGEHLIKFFCMRSPLFRQNLCTRLCVRAPGDVL